MGLEDREWWREGRRQQGHNPSWDNFRAKPDPDPLTPEGGTVLRIQSPAKLRVAPSYPQLHAEQLLEKTDASSTSRLLLVLGLVACMSMLVVGYFVF